MRNISKSTKIKLAIIGCGYIANYHVPALKAVGFKISAVSGRSESFHKVKKFAKKFNIENQFKHSNDLIHSNEWDALLICCPIKHTIDYLKLAAKYKKPILVEKPISDDYTKIKPLTKFNNIRVAFNRRHYKSVEVARKFLDINKSSIIKVSIPESSDSHIDYSNNKLPFRTYTNSIHIFDLINFIAGEIKWEHVKLIRTNKKFTSILAIGFTKNRHHILLDNNYDSPENFSINIISSSKRFELCPIETASLYEGMRITKPTSKNKIRIYNPNLVKTYFEKDNSNFKAGFYNQSLDFMNFCKGKKSHSATVMDAYKSLRAINALFE